MGKGKKKSKKIGSQSDSEESSSSQQTEGSSSSQQTQEPSSSQQQKGSGTLPQQQKSGVPPQQQRSGAPPQQQEWKGQRQQQAWPRPPQQQMSGGQTLQQRSGGPAQQQAWPKPPQQEMSGGQTLQQRSGGPAQQQAWPKPPQQQISGGPPHQQRSGGPPQQQAWKGQPQQQAWPKPPQQQMSGGQTLQQRSGGPAQQQARAIPPQQQISGGPPHQQRSGGPPQQQAWKGQPQQQAWPRPLHQQISGGPPHQQRSGGPSQQQASGRPPQQQGSGALPKQGGSGDVSKQHEQKPSRPSTSTHKPEPFTETFTHVPRGNGNGKSVMPSHLQQSYMDQIPLKSQPSGGTRGRRIQVDTNMLRLIFPKNFETQVVHYDVVIEPDRPKCLLRRVFEEFRKMQCPNRYPAYDGKKNAYSARSLPFGDQSPQITVTIYDQEYCKNRSFTVCLTKAADLDLTWLKNYSNGISVYEKERKDLQALDIIFRHGPASQYTPVGRSIFQPPITGRVVSLSNGLDLWVGMFSAIVIGSKPYLNIDVAHKGFPTPQTVTSLMDEYGADLNNGTISNDAKTKVSNFLKGLKVQYEVPGQPTSKRTYRVNGLVECARNNRFQLDDGTECTVEEYFSQHKRYRIEQPFLPCVWVGSRNSKIYLPAELCTIVSGQATQKKMDDQQTSKMIRYAATDTEMRKKKIIQAFSQMNLNNQPTLTKEFHLSVQGQFERVPARVLDAPKLKYKDKPVSVYKGVWRPEEFLVQCDLPDNSWTILNLDKYVKENDLYMVQDKLQRGGSSLKMRIGKASTPFQCLMIQRDNRNMVQYFERMKKQNIKMVIVILPNIMNAYSYVKQISELHITGGIVTQCVKSDTLRRRMNDATVSNILLKINSKLNGINHTIGNCPPCLQIPCMIVGADVTHPSPDAVNIPSIAAVAASHDPNAFKYNIELRLQSPKEEMIQDLENIMISQLKFFYGNTRQKPRRIIFYRDGVSEGDLPRVMHFELKAIKKAIAYLQKDNTEKIPITFLVVQKRHHVRLFPTDKANSDDRNFNVQAGTIVDQEITHPTHIDFYLVSHASIQGTARPTKYRCISNEENMSEDDIEQLTYYLCHMFARCTRSVSYPAPTYYAHLAAFRARAYIQDVALDINNLQREQQRIMDLKINKNSPMFFV